MKPSWIFECNICNELKEFSTEDGINLHQENHNCAPALKAQIEVLEYDLSRLREEFEELRSSLRNL